MMLVLKKAKCLIEKGNKFNQKSNMYRTGFDHSYMNFSKNKGRGSSKLSKEIKPVKRMRKFTEDSITSSKYGKNSRVSLQKLQNNSRLLNLAQATTYYQTQDSKDWTNSKRAKSQMRSRGKIM